MDKTVKIGKWTVKLPWLVGAIAVVVVAIGLAIALQPKRLNGSYTVKINLFFVEAKDTLKFEGDKVTEYADGKKTNTGTYKIDGDELEVNMSEGKMTAQLAKDKTSFTITHADGLADLGSGLKYTKEQ